MVGDMAHPWWRGSFGPFMYTYSGSLSSWYHRMTGRGARAVHTCDQLVQKSLAAPRCTGLAWE